MIKRITIENYMAHKHTTLELGPGVTVLTGPNNTGKSAVVEAIRSVAQNPAPQHVIRHGAARALVRVELDSGEIIEWVRSKGNTVYHLYRPGPDDRGGDLADEVYAKFGRTPPDDIRNLLRLDLVDTESGAVDIHIGNQRYPIFLLDQSGSQAASFFAASTEAEYLLRMQQALKSRTDHSKSRRKELLVERTQLDQELECYGPLDSIAQEVTRAEVLHAAIIALQQSLPAMEHTIAVLEQTRQQLDVSINRSRVLDRLDAPPAMLETHLLEERVQALAQTQAHLTTASASLEVLVALANLPQLGETSRLDAVLDALAATERSLEQSRQLGANLEALPIPPTLHELRPLAGLVADLAQTQRVGTRAAAAGQVLADLHAAPEMGEIATLKTLIHQIQAAEMQHGRCRLQVEALEQLPPAPDARALQPLETLIGELRHGEARLQRVATRASMLTQLALCPEALACTGIAELTMQLEQLGEALQQNEQLQRQIAAAIALKREDIAALLDATGSCPLCGQLLDMAHFLEEAHA
jgi:hypothetical protein